MSGKLIIYVNNIIKNIKSIKNKSKDALFCAVVKANAYGFGIELCKYINKHVDYYAVATITEAEQVCNYTNKPILVLTPPDKSELNKNLIDNPNIEYAVDSLEVLKYLIAKKLNYKIHIAVNTGMNRYGTNYKTFIQMLELLYHQQYVKLVGVFSHFYQNTSIVMNKQYSQFKKYIKLAKQYNSNIICHISNSGGTKYSLNMVRVGIGLYNTNYCDSFTLQSYVKGIRTINKGDIVSYNKTFIASKPTKVAVVPLGYADGIMRSMGGGKVIINNTLCNIIGTICMDCFMVDVSKIMHLKVGTTVIIVGQTNKQSINICQVAKKCGTINYEVLARLSNRIQRVYKK